MTNFETWLAEVKAANAPTDLARAVKALEICPVALKKYKTLKGDAFYWPDHDLCARIETPAIDALAKLENME